MRHFAYTIMLMLIAFFALPVYGTAAESSADKRDLKIDGQTWLSSSEDEKLAFLLGVEVMIATEKVLAERMGETRKAREDKPPYSGPSPFVRGWLKAFEDTDRRQIMAELDKYIETHPDAQGRHIFEIIWHEFIVPKAGLKWQKKD